MQSHIENKLQTRFNPIYLEVVNESHMHNVPVGSQSHFKVVIVSDHFNDQLILQQHRMVNEVLAEELAEHIHALAIHTYTPKQWEKLSVTLNSPECLG